MQILLICSDGVFEETVGTGYDLECCASVEALGEIVHGASAWNDSATARCKIRIGLLHLLTSVK